MIFSQKWVGMGIIGGDLLADLSKFEELQSLLQSEYF